MLKHSSTNSTSFHVYRFDASIRRKQKEHTETTVERRLFCSEQKLCMN